MKGNAFDHYTSTNVSTMLCHRYIFNISSSTPQSHKTGSASRMLEISSLGRGIESDLQEEHRALLVAIIQRQLHGHSHAIVEAQDGQVQVFVT